MSGDWRRSLLGNHIDLLTGYPFSSEEYTDEVDDLRLLRGDNLHQGHIDWTDAKKWPASKAGELKQYFLQEGDVVLAMDRTWVSAGLKLSTIAHADLPCLLVQRVARIRGVNGLVSSFLRHTIESHQFSEYVKSVQTATAVPHISARQIRDFPILLPSAHEQQAIARILDVWDRGIRQLADLIAAKVRFKQGLMQQLLTGKRRFKGFNDEWHSVHLKDVAEECEERNRGRLGTESVMAVTKADGIVPMRERTIAADIDRYSVVQKDCFAYNPMRLNIGSIARWTGDDDILVSPDYVVFRCKEAIDADFLDQYRRSGLWERYVTSSGNGSVRIRIYFADLAAMKLRLPPLSEQRKIAAVLLAADREIDLLRKQLDAFKQQKRGLMQKLLTGQVRVKIKD